MTRSPATPAHGLRDTAGAVLRWFTAFDPFGPWTAGLERR